MREAKIQSLILGCTHYVALKGRLSKALSGVELLSQDDIIPVKLEAYLKVHPEMEERLSKGGTFALHATDTNENFKKNIDDLMGAKTPVTQAAY